MGWASINLYCFNLVWQQNHRKCQLLFFIEHMESLIVWIFKIHAAAGRIVGVKMMWRNVSFPVSCTWRTRLAINMLLYVGQGRLYLNLPGNYLHPHITTHTCTKTGQVLSRHHSKWAGTVSRQYRCTLLLLLHNIYKIIVSFTRVEYYHALPNLHVNCIRDQRFRYILDLKAWLLSMASVSKNR